MSGPWEKYAAPVQPGPWNKYAQAVAAPTPVEFEHTFLGDIGQNLGNLVAGGVRGAGSIGATILYPIDKATDMLMGDREANVSSLITGNAPLSRNEERRRDMDSELASMGAEPDSLMYKGGKLAGEIAGTAGAGGAIANGTRALPTVAKYAPEVANLLSKFQGLGGTALANTPTGAKIISAIESGGFSLGSPVATTLGGKAADLGIRAIGGSVAGGAQAAMIDPKDAKAGAALGSVLPVGVTALGGAARMAANAVMPAKPINALRDALGLSEAEFNAMVAKARAGAAPIVPGSDLTLAQALEKAGANTAQVKILEKLVAQGPGGGALANRYAAQDAARMNALQAQGAETYQGAPMMEKVAQGSKIGAVLRTQAADANDANRQAWEALRARAERDGVRVMLPLEEMKAAMGPLGPGTVKSGADARAVLREADNIGMEAVDGINPVRDAVSARPKTLAQAVRQAGGLSMRENDGLAGELRGLKGDLKNLVRANGGLSPGRMAEKMREAGYLDDEGADTLFQALRTDANGTAQYSMNDTPERAWRAAQEAAMGDAPMAERLPIPVPFNAFQNLRRDSGALGAKAAEDAARGAESKVLYDFEQALSRRMDEAAGGAPISGDYVPASFANKYGQARDATRQFKQDYGQSNNIGAILRKPVGQDYALTGDEVMNKLWHGAQGLEGDVSNLKGVLSANNYEPTMNALRKFVLTDAAGKTKASGDLGAALPAYVEQRMPGLREALTPDQFNALSSVAADIKNAAGASTLNGAAGAGSDTYAKMANALDTGVMDGPIAKTLAKIVTVKGLGGENARNWMANKMKESRGKDLAELLASPGGLQMALSAGSPLRNSLLEIMARSRSIRGRDVGSIGEAAQRVAVPVAAD